MTMDRKTEVEPIWAVAVVCAAIVLVVLISEVECRPHYDQHRLQCVADCSRSNPPAECEAVCK